MISFACVSKSLGAAVLGAGLLLIFPEVAASDPPSAAILDYRHHMFDPPVMTLANRTIELMFDTVKVPAGTRRWTLPDDSRPLDFTYEFDGKVHRAADVLEDTYTDALLIIKDGVIVNETYLNRTDPGTHFMSYSMAKTLNSVMVGFAIQDGHIGAVTDQVTKYVPELKGSAYDGATLRDVLRMRSGSDWSDNFFREGPAKDINERAFMRNEVRFVTPAFSSRRAHPPGAVFNYNTVDAAVIGLVLERAVGYPISRYMAERLWEPAGMENYGFYVLDGPPGIGREFTGGGFNAVLRDYGRLALMMAQGGAANGSQLLSAEWIKESTAATASPADTGDADLGYAYFWWTLPGTDAYTALGGEGQFIFVDPATHTAVVKFSHSPVGPTFQRTKAETIAFLKAASLWRPSLAAPADQPSLPRISAALAQTPASHAFSASAQQNHPLDLRKYGYTEEEYLVSGQARVFDWSNDGPKALAQGPYTTRILIRRPRVGKASGTVIVEPLNPSVDVDLPIMWAESHEQFIADGDVWVGITIKPNTIDALRRFDPVRYASVAMPNPRPGPACAAADINAFAKPTTPAEETGLAWDMLSQLGALLKSTSAVNPLHHAADRLYMTGQSQTAGYARLYASVFGRIEIGPDHRPLYDGYLYSGSPPWQVPINQCWSDLPAGDPRLITAAAGVPIVEIFTQGDMKTNIETRRADGDTAPDLFRRYEIAGASHEDPWESLSFAAAADMTRAHGRMQDDAETLCSPKGVQPSDFPVRYAFDAAWHNLNDWVRSGIAPPHGMPLELNPSAAPLPPDQAFIVDDFGNAKGGVRSPYVDVPTARWVGAKSGPFVCLFHGYKLPFNREQLQRLYPTHADYVAAVRASASALTRQKWLTSADGSAIIREAQAAQIP